MLKPFLKKTLPASFRWLLRREYLHFRAWWYKGIRYHCPCCEKNYRTFLPMNEGAAARPNVVCPGCGVVERHRMLMLFLKEKTNIYKQPHRVLYFAPEYSLQSHLKCQPNIDYLSTDIDSALAMQQFDIMDIPYPDNSFSVIFCSHVLAHVKNDRLALKELYRILQPSGTLFILDTPSKHLTTLEFSDVQTPEERKKTYGQSDRWRLYGQDFVTRIEAIGFQVEVNHFAMTLPPDIIEKCGISPKEKIFLCRKS